MKQLFKEHYQAIIKRGLITKNTHVFEFLEKLDEEVKELNESFNYSHLDEKFVQEAIDCICVMTNMLQHFGVDIEKALKKNINFQKARK